MKKISSGRKVDISGINVDELILWINSDKHARNIIKCHAIIALHNGNSMQNVCAVLSITRETVRKWKQSLRQEGIAGLLTEKKIGKRSKINPEHQIKLRKILKQNPKLYGFTNNKWSGVLIQSLLYDKWNISIGIRTAQIWIRKLS